MFWGTCPDGRYAENLWQRSMITEGPLYLDITRLKDRKPPAGPWKGASLPRQLILKLIKRVFNSFGVAMPELIFDSPGPVASAFMKSTAFVRGLRGPVGSGKSVTCCIEVVRRALEQRKGPDGIRHSRWAIVRNTQPELKTTTIKTWLDWFPESGGWGKFNWSPPFTHMMKFGDVECEVIFLALDMEDDVQKLRSLELTGLFINEARYIMKAIVDGATERVGRYPSKRMGGPSWYGVIMDSNAMDPDHWWPILSGEMPPPEEDYNEDDLFLLDEAEFDFEFFSQPGGLVERRNEAGKLVGYDNNPAAENVPALPDNYYQRQLAGKAKEWVDRFLLNKIVVHHDGKPVYGSYNAEFHLSSEPLPILENADVLIGVDFGLTPALLFAQQLNGRWLIQRELVFTNSGIKRASPHIRKLLQQVYPGRAHRGTGDPSGDARAQSDESTPFDILRAEGFNFFPASSNDPVIRVESVESVMTRVVDGRSAFLIDPSCKHLSKACSGGYHYPKLKVSGTTRHAETPLKNMSSHVAEALQYLLLGSGEGRALTTKPGARKGPSVAKRGGSIWSRRRRT
tara:strand:- start:435 stop:2141 length:1707 start_codon:yes stop_codon:yes gene_type:complete